MESLIGKEKMGLEKFEKKREIDEKDWKVNVR